MQLNSQVNLEYRGSFYHSHGPDVRKYIEQSGIICGSLHVAIFPSFVQSSRLFLRKTKTPICQDRAIFQLRPLPVKGRDPKRQNCLLVSSDSCKR